LLDFINIQEVFFIGESNYEKIEKLAELKEKGLISEEEFEQEKKKLLASSSLKDEKSDVDVIGDAFKDTVKTSTEKIKNTFNNFEGGNSMDDSNTLARKAENKALTSMILGILSLIFIFTGTAAFIGFILGIIGLVLGINANKISKNGKATAGIVMSIIGIVVCLIVFVVALACVSAAATALSTYPY